MKNFLLRFKSWAVWLSISALIVFCVKEFGGVDISSTVDGLLNVLLRLCVRTIHLSFPLLRDLRH